MKSEKSIIFNFEFKFYIFLFTLCIVLGIAGCATVPMATAPRQENIPGAYHRVTKGQTLWRISKIYGVDIEDLVKANRISDAANIEIGQLILVPKTRGLDAPVIKPVSFEDFSWPLKGKIVAAFGQNSNGMINRGIDIQPYASEVEVTASRSGKVVFYHPDFKDFGKTLIIDHGDGFSTVYARNSQVYVKVGDNLPKGSVISKISAAAGRGRNRYLHFQIVKGHIPQNPYFYLTR